MSKLFIIAFLLLTHLAHSQNFILNPDAEVYTGCPAGLGTINHADYWLCANVYCTSEYFNSCATYYLSDEPYNYWGYQAPHNGSGMVGFYIYDSTAQYREYAECTFTGPLVAGECYELNVHINLANNCKFTTDNFGALFSDTSMTHLGTTAPVSFASPQIINPTGAVFDTLGWTTMTGTYTATGGEMYLLLGNFKADFEMNIIPYNAGGTLPTSYVFVDDVCLHPCAYSCTSGVSVEEDWRTKISVYPNPFENQITIQNANLVNEFILYDVSGKIALRQTITQNTIDTQMLPQGWYIYEIKLKDGSSRNGKLVKE